MNVFRSPVKVLAALVMSLSWASSSCFWVGVSSAVQVELFPGGRFDPVGIVGVEEVLDHLADGLAFRLFPELSRFLLVHDLRQTTEASGQGGEEVLIAGAHGHGGEQVLEGNGGFAFQGAAVRLQGFRDAHGIDDDEMVFRVYGRRA